MKRLLIVSLLGLALANASPARAEETTSSPVSTEKERARDWMKKGVEAFNAGRYEDARSALRESVSLRESYDAAGVLGQSEMALGDYPSAATHLAYCIDHYPTGGKRELLKKVEEAFAEVAKKVVELRIFANVDGSKVFVDGTLIGKTPLDRRFVAAGDREIVVESPSGASEHRVVTKAAGESATVTVAFAESAPTTSEKRNAPKTSEPRTSEREPEASVPESSASWKWPVVISTGVVGLVGVGVGVGFLVDSEGKANEASELGDDACASGGAECSLYLDRVSGANDSLTLSVVGFAAGGAFLATSLAAALLWPDGEATSTAAKTRWFALPTPGGAAFGVRGSF